MEIVDSHLHVWSDDPARYPWRPLPGFGAPSIPGSLELLLRLQSEAGVSRTVVIQPSNYGYDHSYILDSARRYPGRFAVVCLVDPEAPDAGHQLAQMVRVEGCSGLRLRPLVNPRDWRWLTDPATYDLWRAAGEAQAPISLLILPNQIEALGEMAARFPEVTVIVDHLGRQYAEESPAYAGADSLLALADLPNTYVKISALSAASAQPYPYADAIDLVRRIYDRFGARRLMWGTDFPYVQEKEGYVNALALVEQYTFMSAEDKEWLLGRTVAGLYSFDAGRRMQ
ncbi:MAG: amidohydrolase family protein [Chloroflexota bacterium]